MKVFNARLLLLLFVSSASARVGLDQPELQVIQDEHIVILPFDSEPRGLLNGLIQSDQAEILAEYNNAFPRNKAFAVRAKLVALENSLMNTDAIIEPSTVVTATETTQNPTASWGIDRIDSRTFRDNKYTYSRDGSGVDVYIFDTGIYTGHNDFGDRATEGFSAYPDEAKEDGHGHGSHVAGTVGGALYGVAKNVNLIAVKVLNENGSGSSTGLLAGIDWVIGEQKGKTSSSVANMSLGFGGQYQYIDDAINEAVAAGVVMVVAGGNSDVPACSRSPAAAVDAITVGATTTRDKRASYSNYGTCLDLFAPGSSITSVGTDGPTATRTYSGTSMAAPHVAGVAALLLEENPSLTPSQVVSKMLASASVDKLGSIGSGSPNLLVYTGAILGPSPAPTPPAPTPPAPTPPAPTPPAPTPPAPTPPSLIPPSLFPPALTPPAPTPPAPTPPAPTPPAPTPPAPTPPAPAPTPPPPTCGRNRSFCTAGADCCSKRCDTRRNRCRK